MKVNIADFANLSLLGMPPLLQRKLMEAELVSTDAVPPDVVTMHSRVLVADLQTGKRRELSLVYPREADVPAGRVSVLDELGMALFAASVGDTVEYRSAEGRPRVRRLRLVRLLYQPEDWMRTNLVI